METKTRWAVSGILVAVAVALGGVAAWNQSMEQRAYASAAADNQPPPPATGVGTTAPAAGAGLAAILAFVAQFWKPADPKQQAIKRQLEALAVLWSDGVLGQVSPIWNEITKNGIPSALDARIQWGTQTPYFLRWGKIVEEPPQSGPTENRKVT